MYIELIDSLIVLKTIDEAIILGFQHYIVMLGTNVIHALFLFPKWELSSDLKYDREASLEVAAGDGVRCGAGRGCIGPVMYKHGGCLAQCTKYVSVCGYGFIVVEREL